MSRIQKLIKEKCPNGVKFYKLSEVGNHYIGLSGKSKKDFENGNCKYITYSNIYNNPSVQLDVNDSVYISKDEKQNNVKFKDILITGSSENLKDSGMVSVVTEVPKEKIYLNSFCFGFRLNNYFFEKFNAHFLKHLFRDNKIRNEIISCSFGVTRYNLSKEKFLKIKIPCPPLEVQNEIVRTLDKLSELEWKLELELELELELRKTQYEFWRRKLLKKYNNHKIVKLKEIVGFENGKGHERDVSEKGKYILLTSKAVSTNLMKYRRTDEQLLPLYKNDIALVMSDLPKGRALAKCFFVDQDEKYTLNQRVCRISIKDKQILPKYLYYFLDRNDQLLKFDNGVDQTNLRKNDILELNVSFPSLHEQKRIVKVLDQLNKLIRDMYDSIPSEIELRRKQYEYYRNQLLTFSVNNDKNI